MEGGMNTKYLKQIIRQTFCWHDYRKIKKFTVAKDAKIKLDKKTLKQLLKALNTRYVVCTKCHRLQRRLPPIEARGKRNG